MQTDTGEDELHVTLAPLIDCVFLLLIFFLVASTLKEIDKELPIDLPDSAAAMAVQQPDQHTVIAIDADGNFYLDGSPVPIGLLRSELRSLGRQAPQTKVRLDIDERTDFRHVMQILDELHFEGLEQVGVNTRVERAEPGRGG